MPQKQRVRHVGLNQNVCWLRPESGGINIGPHRDDEIEGQRSQTPDRASEHVAGFMENGTQRQVYGSFERQ